jgi:hypothetical protein
LLEDLPEIFERKFHQRVQGLLEEQRRLLADNQILRDRLYALTPATPTAILAPVPSRGRRLRQSLREALESLLRQAGAELPAAASPPPQLNPAADGRTRAA